MFQVGDQVHIIDDMNGVVEKFDGKFYHVRVQRVEHKSSISLCTLNELEKAKVFVEQEKKFEPKSTFQKSATHFFIKLLEYSERRGTNTLTINANDEAAFLEGLKQFRATGRVISVMKTFSGECSYQVAGTQGVDDDDHYDVKNVIEYEIRNGVNV